MRVISLICLLVFGGLVFSAPIPRYREKVQKFSFSGEWDMKWGHCSGRVTMKEDGSTVSYWPCKWMGTWVQEGMIVTFRECPVSELGEAGNVLIWTVNLEPRLDGSFSGWLVMNGVRSTVIMCRVNNLKN